MSKIDKSNIKFTPTPLKIFASCLTGPPLRQPSLPSPNAGQMLHVWPEWVFFLAIAGNSLFSSFKKSWKIFSSFLKHRRMFIICEARCFNFVFRWVKKNFPDFIDDI